jgi:hypothetical protein
MRRFLFAMLCVICALAQANAASSRYLQIAVSGLNDTGNPVCPASLVYDISQEQLLNGAYYIADKSCGITADASAYRPGGMSFEMAFNMKVQTSDQGTWLSGTAYALNYSGEERRGGGERTSVEKALALGKKILVGSFSLQDGRDVQLFATLLDDCPPNNADCGENAVTLITSVSSRGKTFANKTQSRKLLAEAMEFRSVLESDDKDGKHSELQYAAMVRVPDGIRALKEPTRCQIVFQRNYRITAQQTGATKSQSAVSYSSQNVQEVLLEPGKELRLVFPPDEPSVEGFDIEDPLIIVPR